MTAAPVTVTMDRSTAEADRSLDRGHILALDGLRGIAILLVLVCHFVSNLYLTGRGGVEVLIQVGHAGWAGVDLFFVLSGFLITGILLDARGSPSYFRAFYARRVLRILPAYYGFLFVIFVVLPALNITVGDNALLARQHQGWYWLHLTNVMMSIGEIPGRGPYPQTLFWSLAVEEQFYLVWPAVVAFTSAKTLRRICVAGLLGCIALRIIGTVSGVSGLAISVLPFTRGDTLFAGALLAIEHRRRGLDQYLRMVPLACAASALALIGLLVRYRELDYHDAGTAMFGSIAIMLLGASAVAVAVEGRSGFVSALKAPFLRFFGLYSYALYIVHTAVLAALNRYWPFAGLSQAGGLLFPGQTAWFVLYAGLSTGVAFLSWHLVEKHFLRLKRFFPYRPRQGMQTGPG